MSVNLGLSGSLKCVQRSIWAINLRHKRKYTGALDMNTIDNLNKYSNNILAVIRSERANYYRSIVTRNSAKKVFIKGWLNRTYK